MEATTACPKCNLPNLAVFYFCPNCGKSLRSKPLSTSLSTQIGIYILSLLLPPLGLWPGIKYLFQKKNNAKIIGVAAVVLTLISTGITVYFGMKLLNQFTRELNTQLQINPSP